MPNKNAQMPKQPCVYIMASKRNGTVYVGVTSNIQCRAWQHREGIVEGFTKKYGVKRLVYYEFLADMPGAIRREKQIKAWTRKSKLTLIESSNPSWKDLFYLLFDL
jgi:putative endonuclease